MNAVHNLLTKASDAYYRGVPIMSDETFDRLAEVYKFNKVGHQITDGVPHIYPMYSLKKCFDLADAPIDLAKCIKTPKLDGAAVSLLYIDNVFTLGLTRGDGKLGQDITDKLRCLVPKRLGCRESIVQITGEVVAPKSIPNARNYAAGALNLKSVEEFITRELTFVAYDFIKNPLDTWSEAMQYLYNNEGFMTVYHLAINPALEFPTDGEVFRLDSTEEFNAAGYTSSHPRGAFALKTKKEGVVTKLLEVIWQPGKSGIISPVAILEPVNIDGATVSRATLHNIEYIEGLGLEIGCDVEVIRSGDIIPRIVRKV